MRRLWTIIVCLMLIMAMAIPVSAATMYNSRTETIIKFNVKEYPATLFINENRSNGVRMGATCQAVIPVRFVNLTVVYDTYNYGYWTDSGGARIETISVNRTTVYSYYVPCSKGTDQVIDCLRADGTAVFQGDNDYWTDVRHEYIT